MNRSARKSGLSSAMWTVATLMVSLAVAYAGNASITDDFEGPSQTVSERYTVMSGTWANEGGSLVASGRTQKVLLLEIPDLQGGPARLAVDFRIADISKGKPAVGIYLSYRDKDDSCVFRYRGGELSVFQLISDRGGNPKAQNFEPALPMEAGVWYRATIESIADDIYRFSVARRDAPDQVVVSTEAKPGQQLEAGRIGFYVAKESDASFDNLFVEPR